MQKNIKIYLILFLSICLASYLWSVIYLPVITDLNYGAEYLEKSYNKNNDVFRFVVFVIVSLTPFLYFNYIYFKDENYTIIEFVNLKNSNNVKNESSLYYIYIFFIFGTLIEFLSIDFSTFISQLDFFHEGIWLTASSNYLITKNFWISSYIDRGIFGNFYPLILWEVFNNSNIGFVRLSNLIILLFCKISLLTLALQISLNLNFNRFRKIIFYLFLSISFLSLVNYFNDAQFVKRSLLTLIFLNILIHVLKNSYGYSFLYFLLGSFSVLSMLWFLDIGAYINFIIFLLLALFLIRSEYKIFLSIISGVIFGWIIFYFHFSAEEIESFLFNTASIYSTIDQIHGLIYPTPFFSADSRATKTLIFFVIGGIFCIKLCLNKKNNFNNTNKIFFFLLFILSLVSFKTGLSRSDSAHIKTSIGPLMIILFTYAIYLLVVFFDKKLKNKIHDKYKNVSIILISFLVIILNFNFLDAKKIKYSISNINNLISASDSSFFIQNKNEYVDLISYYKEISKNDNCIQIFTDDVALPFLLSKKTCSKYYQTWIGQPEFIQSDLIRDLESNLPNIILLKSDLHKPYNYNLIDNYIEKNYIFHSKFKYWTFVKRK